MTLTDPLLYPERLQQFLQQHQLPPLHRFGQHFLIDPEVLSAMVRVSAPDPAVPILEVGAGLGVLTRALASEREKKETKKDVAPLIAVELDRRLIAPLRERTRKFSQVRILHADILRLSFEKASVSLPYDVVGNIPYNISGKLLERFLTQLPRPRHMTFLMDAAVAEAITAQPPEMSIRAVSVQAFADARIVEHHILPEAFLPPPAVQSSIVSFTIRKEPLVSAAQERAFFRLVRAGFSQKRKVLANALAATYRIPPRTAAARLRDAGIDSRRRAQTLSVEEWLRLLNTWEHDAA